MKYYSNCCGTEAQGGEDYGICPECLEHCEFETEETENEYLEVSDNPSYEVQ
jgi:hypothetical protein